MLPLSGPITARDINIELDRSPTYPFSLNDPEVRELAGREGSGTPISFSDFYGKSSGFDVTSTLSGTYNRLELRDHFISMGWDGIRKLKGTVTISGYCYSDNINAYGLYVRNLSAESKIRIVITGSIRGKGGNGGRVDGGGTVFIPAQNGGHALYVYNHNGSIIEIDNQGWIGGGGGGGAFGVASTQYGVMVSFGGGGGAGTEIGLGGDGPETNGTATTGGLARETVNGRFGGNGGNLGQPGTVGLIAGQTPGAAGHAVVGNNRINWINVGTIYGARINN